FSTGYTQTSTSMFSRNIKAWKNGTIDASAQASTSYTHSTTTTDSTAVTVEQSIGLSRDYPGPACDYCGVDHDYDQILVWLNSVMAFRGGPRPDCTGSAEHSQDGPLLELHIHVSG